MMSWMLGAAHEHMMHIEPRNDSDPDLDNDKKCDR